MSPLHGRENCYLSPSSSAGVSSTASHQSPSCPKTQCCSTPRVVFNIENGTIVKRPPPLEDRRALAVKLSWPNAFSLFTLVVLTLYIISFGEWRDYTSTVMGYVRHRHDMAYIRSIERDLNGEYCLAEWFWFFCVAKDPCNRQSC